MNDKTDSEQVNLRTMVVAALGISLTVWDIAFNLGAHGTIFYSKIQMLWVAATVVLLCVLLTGRSQHQISKFGVGALLSPTIWFSLNALTPLVEVAWYEQALLLASLGIFVIATPYILYILFTLIESDLVGITAFHRNRLFGIILFIALAGYLIGRLNPYFVSCQQFEVAGDAQPKNCINW